MAAVGDASGASLATLLRYLYTESFEPEALSGKGGALSLLRLTARFEAAVCAVDGHVVALGGENSHHAILDSAEVYQAASDTWAPLPEARLPSPTTDLRCTVVRGGFRGGTLRVGAEAAPAVEEDR